MSNPSLNSISDSASNSRRQPTTINGQDKGIYLSYLIYIDVNIPELKFNQSVKIELPFLMYLSSMILRSCNTKVRMIFVKKSEDLDTFD